MEIDILGDYTQKSHDNVLNFCLQVGPGMPWPEKTIKWFSKPSPLICGFNLKSIQRHFQQTWVIQLGNSMGNAVSGRNRGVTIK